MTRHHPFRLPDLKLSGGLHSADILGQSLRSSNFGTGVAQLESRNVRSRYWVSFALHFSARFSLWHWFDVGVESRNGGTPPPNTSSAGDGDQAWQSRGKWEDSRSVGTDATRVELGRTVMERLLSKLQYALCKLLEAEFPKLRSLAGGWLLYKAPGGSGRRRLIVVPPDSEGYTGNLIKMATTTGRTALYMVPLQDGIIVPTDLQKKCIQLVMKYTKH
ncbi:uncharacterized protein [Pseudorasbora parva]|uniref:uncharacterized protein n=1 Tax=Pseudorasbora parva TaxID=51549 RepID=UPI00351DD8AF